MSYKPSQLAEWLDVSVSTLRLDSAIFGDFLSPGANPSKGRHRIYTDLDARMLYAVRTMRNEGLTEDEIITALADITDHDYRDLPEMPPAPPGKGPVPMVPRQAAETAIETQRAALLREITLLEERVEDLEQQLATERLAHIETRTILTESRERLGHLQGQLEAVDRERELLDSERERERLNWSGEKRLLMRGLLALAVVAAILLAVIVLLAIGGFPPA